MVQGLLGSLDLRLECFQQFSDVFADEEKFEIIDTKPVARRVGSLEADLDGFAQCSKLNAVRVSDVYRCLF